MPPLLGISRNHQLKAGEGPSLTKLIITVDYGGAGVDESDYVFKKSYYVFKKSISVLAKFD